jgi:hypothetical protein
VTFDNTYVHNLLYGLDIYGAILIFNQRDVTISSLCRLVQLYDFAPGLVPQFPGLKLWKWQIAVLRALGPILDKIQTSHCEGARQADIARANRVLALLS